jgi:hypothetical protein
MRRTVREEASVGCSSCSSLGSYDARSCAAIYTESAALEARIPEPVFSSSSAGLPMRGSKQP